MANNILYVSDGDYGTPAGYLLPLMQGQFGQSVPLEIRDLAGNVINLTGYTFTATKRKGSTVTAWVGSIVLSATPTAAPQVTLTVDEDDTGTDGGFNFFLEGTNGSQVLKTHPVSLAITKDPAVNATPSPGLVSVTTAQKALLATISGLTGLVKMAGGVASAILIKLDGTTAPGVNDDSGDGYTIGSLWVDTTNDNAYICTDASVGAANWLKLNSAGDLTTHTALSTTAHGGILPEDAGIVTVSSGRDLATTDRGKVLECNGTFTLTCPNGISGNLQCVIVNIGSGVITLAATTTLTTKDSAVTLANQYGAATVYHAGSNVWRAFGDLS